MFDLLAKATLNDAEQIFCLCRTLPWNDGMVSAATWGHSALKIDTNGTGEIYKLLSDRVWGSFCLVIDNH